MAPSSLLQVGGDVWSLDDAPSPRVVPREALASSATSSPHSEVTAMRDQFSDRACMGAPRRGTGPFAFRRGRHRPSRAPRYATPLAELFVDTVESLRFLRPVTRRTMRYRPRSLPFRCAIVAPSQGQRARGSSRPPTPCHPTPRRARSSSLSTLARTSSASRGPVSARSRTLAPSPNRSRLDPLACLGSVRPEPPRGRARGRRAALATPARGPRSFFPLRALSVPPRACRAVGTREPLSRARGPDDPLADPDSVETKPRSPPI